MVMTAVVHVGELLQLVLIYDWKRNIKSQIEVILIHLYIDKTSIILHHL